MCIPTDSEVEDGRGLELDGVVKPADESDIYYALGKAFINLCCIFILSVMPAPFNCAFHHVSTAQCLLHYWESAFYYCGRLCSVYTCGTSPLGTYGFN